jgi:hypothetical protein
MNCPQTTQIGAGMGKEYFLCVHPRVLRVKAFSTGVETPETFGRVFPAFSLGNPLCHFGLNCPPEFRVIPAV